MIGKFHSVFQLLGQYKENKNLKYFQARSLTLSKSIWNAPSLPSVLRIQGKRWKLAKPPLVKCCDPPFWCSRSRRALPFPIICILISKLHEKHCSLLITSTHKVALQSETTLVKHWFPTPTPHKGSLRKQPHPAPGCGASTLELW